MGDMGDNAPFWFQRGFFLKCIHNLRDQRFCSPMTHPVGFPSGNWGAVLTMRNHKLKICSIFPVQYSEERNLVIIQRMEKKPPEIIMKQTNTGGYNIKRCSTLFQQTKFCSLHLLREVCEHWVMSSDGGVAVITWIGKSLIQQFADLEGANGNTMHWGKGVTPTPSSWSSSINLPSLWNRN